MKYTFDDLKNGIKPCFLAGTLIHTIKGLIPIEKIKQGDKVYCYDEIKQKVTQSSVSQIYKNFAVKYAKIKTDKGTNIEVTGQHLFYQKGSGTWIKAHQLKEGMHLYNPTTNTQEKITKKRS